MIASKERSINARDTSWQSLRSVAPWAQAFGQEKEDLLILVHLLHSKIFKEKEMSALKKEMVHYVKFDIKNWTGPEERITIKQSMRVTTVEQQQYFTWSMTRQRREWVNGIRGDEDENWVGWQAALDIWSDLRSEHGQDIVIWIGKPCFTAKYKKGQVSPNIRLPESIGILQFHKKTQELRLTILQQEWVDKFEFVDTNNSMYNKTASWRNPLTTVLGGTKKGAWQ